VGASLQIKLTDTSLADDEMFDLEGSEGPCYKLFLLYMPSRVARLYISKPNIPIWVHFGGPRNGKCWYILFLLEYLNYGNLVYFRSIL
jgi:hypothetical protein